MTENIFSVRIAVKEGPIKIKSLNGNQLNEQYTLWDNIVASEHFPANVDSAFYLLSLEKSVSIRHEVYRVESELVDAINLIAWAWPFSGGSFINLEMRKLVISPRYESNAKEIEEELLAREGFHQVESNWSATVEIIGGYCQPPLEAAIRIVNAMRRNPALHSLMKYYHQAWLEYYHRHRTERSSWFIDLYKIQDVLKEIYCMKKFKEGNALKISKVDWSFFEKTLNNNDLRHAEISGNAPSVTREDVDRLYRLARTWIQSHLIKQGLIEL